MKKSWYSNSDAKMLEEYIGKQLREKRIKRGLTLSKVASVLGCSHQQIQKYEQGQSRVSAIALYKLSSLYGIEMDTLFKNQYVEQDDKSNTEVGILSSNQRNSFNLLIIEDDPGEEELMRKSLTSFSNLRILCVHDGVQAIEFLRYKTLCMDFPRPDLIFLDLNLPKRSGEVVLSEIKRDRTIQGIPVIVVTNNLNADVMMNMYRTGASGYICKSFDFDVFKKNLADCLNYWYNVVVLPHNKE